MCFSSFSICCLTVCSDGACRFYFYFCLKFVPFKCTTIYLKTNKPGMHYALLLATRPFFLTVFTMNSDSLLLTRFFNFSSVFLRVFLSLLTVIWLEFVNSVFLISILCLLISAFLFLFLYFSILASLFSVFFYFH